MKNSKKNKESNKAINVGRIKETYLDGVGAEALKRVGKNTQIKGTIHEVMIKNNKNTSLDNIVNGKVTKLTKSTTAKTSDLVTVQNGKVVERIQAKDVTDSSAIREIKKKVKTKQYRNAKLVGTNETTELYNKAAKKGTKKMKSSNISSKTTTRVADNTGVKVPNKNIFKNNIQDVSNQSVQSGMYGAAIGGVVSSVSNGKRFIDGEINGEEFAKEVAVDVVTSGVKSATKTGAALLVKEGGKQLAKKVGGEALKKVAGSNPATAVAFGVVDQGLDRINLIKGDIDGTEYLGKTVENVGGTGGAIGGAAAGAAIGSVVPVVGTAIGAVVGGIVGGIGGSAVGSSIKDFFGWY